jgi:hypothetical protein
VHGQAVPVHEHTKHSGCLLIWNELDEGGHHRRGAMPNSPMKLAAEYELVKADVDKSNAAELLAFADAHITQISMPIQRH